MRNCAQQLSGRLCTGAWSLSWAPAAPGNSAPCRSQQTLCYCAALNVAVVFGGYSTQEGHLNDLWVLDMTSDELRKPKDTGSFPTARRGHCAEVIGQHMWVFGGASHGSMLADTYKLCLKTWRWTLVGAVGEAPSARRAAASSVVDDRWLVIGGGFDGAHCLGDVHVLDTLSGIWAPLELAAGSNTNVPAPRALHSMCTTAQGVLVYGGASQGTVLASAYLLHNKAMAGGAQLQLAHERCHSALVRTECKLSESRIACELAASSANEADSDKQVCACGAGKICLSQADAVCNTHCLMPRVRALSEACTLELKAVCCCRQLRRRCRR